MKALALQQLLSLLYSFMFQNTGRLHIAPIREISDFSTEQHSNWPQDSLIDPGFDRLGGCVSAQVDGHS